MRPHTDVLQTGVNNKCDTTRTHTQVSPKIEIYTSQSPSEYRTTNTYIELYKYKEGRSEARVQRGIVLHRAETRV